MKCCPGTPNTNSPVSSTLSFVWNSRISSSQSATAYWLGKFVLETRKKKDGSEYPPKSLYGLVCCFKHYFEANERFDVNPLSLNDARFGPLCQTLDVEKKMLHKKGLGTKQTLL